MHRDVEVGDMSMPTLVKEDIVRFQIAWFILEAAVKKPGRAMEVPTDGLYAARGGMQAPRKSRQRSNARFLQTASLVCPSELHEKGMMSALGMDGVRATDGRNLHLRSPPSIKSKTKKQFSSSWKAYLMLTTNGWSILISVTEMR